MIIKPWEKIGPEQVLAESHNRSLVTQRYLDPHDKKEVEYSIFRGKSFSSIILGINKENDVLAVEQYRHAVNAVTLELIGGSQKYSNQNPREVALEEFAEETSGYQPTNIIPLLEFGCWFEPSSTEIIYYPFLFVECVKSNKQAKPDDGEYLRLIQIPSEDWVKMCENGVVRDSKSLAVTLLAKKYLRN